MIQQQIVAISDFLCYAISIDLEITKAKKKPNMAKVDSEYT